MIDAVVTDVTPLAPFRFRWPAGQEDFEGGWDYVLVVGNARHRVRHGVGGREVYGRARVHTVTWLDGEVQVEGVEADDYPATRSLLSLLRVDAKKLVGRLADVPAGYEDFELVDHRREIDAKWSRRCIAVKIQDDDLTRWAVHALLRMRQRQRRPLTRSAVVTPVPETTPFAPAAGTPNTVADALIAHGKSLAASLVTDTARFTPDQRANALILDDPFAFLIAVLCDQGIVAERAWAIPYELQHRLGHLDPQTLAADPQTVAAAFAHPPKLHRFVNQVALGQPRRRRDRHQLRWRCGPNLERPTVGGRATATLRRADWDRSEEGSHGGGDPGTRPARTAVGPQRRRYRLRRARPPSIPTDRLGRPRPDDRHDRRSASPAPTAARRTGQPGLGHWQPLGPPTRPGLLDLPVDTCLPPAHRTRQRRARRLSVTLRDRAARRRQIHVTAPW